MAISTGMALLGSAALGVGGAIYSGSQAVKAGETSAAAAERAGQITQGQYEQTRTDLAPWREIGEQALYQYADELRIPVPGATGPSTFESGFETSPGYQFRLDEGQKAIERSASARGVLGSGGTQKALTRYAQGVASDEYGSYMNRLAGAAGIGQTATTQTAQFGAGAAGALGQAELQAGQARASGYLGQGQAAQQAISGIQGLGGYYVGQQQNEALLRALGA